MALKDTTTSEFKRGTQAYIDALTRLTPTTSTDKVDQDGIIKELTKTTPRTHIPVG